MPMVYVNVPEMSVTAVIGVVFNAKEIAKGG